MMYQNDRNNGSSAETNQDNSSFPYALIIEQPAPKSIKFRYKSEPSRGGLIFGAQNTPENKSFPKIRVVGYKGLAWVRVTCVTVDEPYRTHPHNLVGKKYCSEGICEMPISHDEMIAEFPNLGIQCVKKNEVEKELMRRQGKNVDPFKVGFEYRNNVSSINLNALRLCFEVFIPTADKQTWISLEPVVSDPIYDKKAKSDLVITRLSHSSASVRGGQEMILLYENVNKDDVVVRFFDERLNWEDFGRFEPEDVHKQVAIYFKTPPYCDTTIKEKVKVNIQLQRKTDTKVTSESRPFFFVPEESDVYGLKWPPYPMKTVDHTENNRYLDVGGITNPPFSNGRVQWIHSTIDKGLPSQTGFDQQSSSSYFPDNNQSIVDLLNGRRNQLQSAISLDQERSATTQLPPIHNNIWSRNKQAKNVNEQNLVFLNDDSQASAGFDLLDENTMSMANCDQLSVTNRSHNRISENDLHPPSTCLERLEETGSCHGNVEDVYPPAFCADPLFSFLHPFKNMDYTSAAMYGYPNSRNDTSIILDEMVNFKDPISNNNMEALSENLSSSLSMST